MNIQLIIVLIIVILSAAWVIRRLTTPRKRKGCSGCSSQCSDCHKIRTASSKRER